MASSIKPTNNINKSDIKTITYNSFIQSLVAFCEESSIHGIKHLASNYGGTRNYPEKLQIHNSVRIVIWILSSVGSAALCVLLITLILNRFQTTPTVTTVETTDLPIWKAEFPAITLSNINKVYAPSTRNIRKLLLNKGFNTTEIDQFFKSLSSLVLVDIEIEPKSFVIFTALLEMGYTIQTIMYEVRQPCETMLVDCYWLGVRYSCEQLFRTTLSSEGYSCSFNYKALKNELEINANHTNVINQLQDSSYHVSGAGVYVSLYVIMDVEEEHYISYTRSFYGIHLFVHNSQDFPQISEIRATAQTSHDVFIAVTPTVIESDPYIRRLPIDQRNCYFRGEYNISLFATKSYSYESCHMECAVKAILTMCNCLPFYYPQNYAKRSQVYWRLCTLHDVQCLRDHRHIFHSIQSTKNITTPAGEQIAGIDCKCLPRCNEQQYESEYYVVSRLGNEELLKETQFNISGQHASLDICMSDMVALKYQRTAYMTWDILFSTLGGVFGLCFGGSVLSLVEFVYCFTIRYLFTIDNEIERYRKKLGGIARRTTEQVESNIPEQNNQILKNMTHYGYYE